MIDRKVETVYIASDHGGFSLKNFLVDKLVAHNYKVEDLGPTAYNPHDDYPDYAKKVGENISKAPNDTAGIVICRNGVGVSVTANKFKDVRCTLSWNPEHAKSARNDDNVNCLALPADYIEQEIALKTALAFLETSFNNEERYVRRLKKVPA